MINNISFKNYKLFKKMQTLEIRPITILIGKNNTGKSAVLKLPTLISGSLNGGFEEPIQLSNYGIKIGVNYSDLVFDKRTIVPLELILESKKDKNVLEELNLSIKFPDKPKEKTEFFEWKHSKNNRIISEKLEDSKFKGFIKDDQHFEFLKLNIDYVGAFRELPKDSYNYNSQVFKKIGIKGENAYSILIQDSIENTGILKKVSEWYQKNFENWKIEVKDIVASDPLYQILLSNDNSQGNKISGINIVNTGQGINQALPLIVRSYMEDIEPVLITIEEPETHLHPAAHGNLAERFVMSYLENKNKNYFIETHSQNFILRLRALVAQGLLKPDELSICYVDFLEEENESILRRIEVDVNGNLPNDDWPEGIFNETSLEISKIINGQLDNVSDEE
mgnify:CR=1 FL=1